MAPNSIPRSSFVLGCDPPPRMLPHKVSARLLPNEPRLAACSGSYSRSILPLRDKFFVLLEIVKANGEKVGMQYSPNQSSDPVARPRMTALQTSDILNLHFPSKASEETRAFVLSSSDCCPLFKIGCRNYIMPGNIQELKNTSGRRAVCPRVFRLEACGSSNHDLLTLL